jgi:MinD superfamily P-loop ATPase
MARGNHTIAENYKSIGACQSVCPLDVISRLVSVIVIRYSLASCHICACFCRFEFGRSQMENIHIAEKQQLTFGSVNVFTCAIAHRTKVQQS